MVEACEPELQVLGKTRKVFDMELFPNPFYAQTFSRYRYPVGFEKLDELSLHKPLEQLSIVEQGLQQTSLLVCGQ